MLWRAVRRRCPWCSGRGAFFTGWFAKRAECRSCGLGWHRGYEGFELGALTISAILVLGPLVVGLVIGVVVTTPDIPLVQLVLALGVGAVGLPIVVYPISYTVWQAVDLALHPPDVADPSVPPPRP